jgi:hypothetical protein
MSSRAVAALIVAFGIGCGRSAAADASAPPITAAASATAPLVETATPPFNAAPGLDAATPPAPPPPAPALQPDAGPPQSDRELKRQARRRARERARLDRAIAIEGPEFSEEKLGSYEHRVQGGGALIGVGGAAVVAGLVYIIVFVVRGIVEGFVEIFTLGASEQDDSGPRFHPAVPCVLLPFGIAALGAGIPLAISGTAGAHRQELLLRKAEIRDSFDEPAVALTLFADPARGAGGVALRVDL